MGKGGMAMSEQAVSATRLWLVMMKAHGAIAAYVEKAIARQELGMSDFMVLEMLLHKGPMTMSAIAESVLLANASMTSAVDRLEKRALVCRVVSEADRRVRVVDLTKHGREFIRPIFAQHAMDLEALMGDMSVAEKQKLYRSLKKVGLTARERARVAT